MAIAQDAWIVDGAYFGVLGSRVSDVAELVVWFDVPARVWFPRLLDRTLRRILVRQVLWSGNRESWRGAFWGADSLFGYALTHVRPHRRDYPVRLAGRPVRRLRSRAAVRELLAELTGRPQPDNLSPS